jgi:hypothetical protein
MELELLRMGCGLEANVLSSALALRFHCTLEEAESLGGGIENGNGKRHAHYRPGSV